MKKIILTTNQKYYFNALAVLAFLVAASYIYWTPGPDLFVSDQVITNGQIIIERLNLPYDGWVVLYSTKYDQPLEMIGKVRVQRGRNKQLGIYVNVLRATPKIEAAVYDDRTTPGLFDLQTDKVVVSSGRPLKAIINKK